MKITKGKKELAIKIAMSGIAMISLWVAYNVFLLNNNLNVGGFTGASLCLAQFGVSYTLTLVVLNSVPFAIALRKKEFGFFAASAVLTVMTGFVLDLMPIFVLQLPFLVQLIIGSVLSGIGFGLICRAKWSTGGSDMLALQIKKWTKCSLSLGVIMDCIDSVVVIAWVLIVPTDNFWLSFGYSILAMLCCNRTIDIIFYYGTIRERLSNLAIVRKTLLIANKLSNQVMSKRVDAQSEMIVTVVSPSVNSKRS